MAVGSVTTAAAESGGIGAARFFGHSADAEESAVVNGCPQRPLKHLATSLR